MHSLKLDSDDTRQITWFLRVITLEIALLTLGNTVSNHPTSILDSDFLKPTNLKWTHRRIQVIFLYNSRYAIQYHKRIYLNEWVAQIVCD